MFTEETGTRHFVAHIRVIPGIRFKYYASFCARVRSRANPHTQTAIRVLRRSCMPPIVSRVTAQSSNTESGCWWIWFFRQRILEFDWPPNGPSTLHLVSSGALVLDVEKSHCVLSALGYWEREQHVSSSNPPTYRATRWTQ